MFTGIIAAVGRIERVEPLGDGVRLLVDAGTLGLDDVAVGDSIAIQGACMTATSVEGRRFTVDVSRESLNHTVGLEAPGEVNLEKALTLADRLGGHLVSGHVDGLAVRWSSRATAVSKLMDGRSESPGESRLRCILGFEGWTLVPQVEVRDESGHVFARLDGVIEGTRVALEFDGRIKYAEGNSAVLLAEKDRGDRLRALNWIVVRVSWSDLEHPARLFTKIRGALATAASLVA